ncbi:hypothetical protein [Salinarchaeum laminariae]|uniref:hypothetical protein n=1 Tax=Salinarchaeum laminariae TaxID=869888 RepID=UPI0020BEBFD9|nr:hypothetical protein [Salinarchaeum laminariae]
MPERSSSERIEEYVAVLRGIGLTESAIADAHGDRERPERSLDAYLTDVLPGTENAELHDQLGDAIAASARGIDAPAEYWNHAPEVHLDELLAPYGCSITIQPSKWADTLAEGKFVVRLTDAQGTEFWTRFDYPDSELGSDNYPALLHHVEEQLLAPAGLRIVRLVAPRGRWRFAMMSVDQLAALEKRYGDRLRIFGAPILAADQPPAFANEQPPVPSWYDPSDESDEADESDISLDVPATESLDDLEPTDADLGFDVDDSPESILDSVEGDDAGSGTTAAAAGEDVEASDDQVQSVFGDLSDVSLEPEDPDPEATSNAGGGTLAIDGGAAAATDADDPMDDLFDELKRDIADTEPETGENADAGREANVADLVESVEEGSPQGEERDDVPQDAADLTASELFSSLGDE